MAPRGDADVIFESWTSVGRVVLTAALVYAALVALVRASGKRTLAKMNAFDFVVTVALGSTLASVVTSKDVPVVDGIVALATLVGLQFAVAWVVARSKRFGRVVKSRPRVLFHDGELQRQAMLEERVSEDEVRAAVRASGARALAEVESVVLESSGDISVVRRDPERPQASVVPPADEGRPAAPE